MFYSVKEKVLELLRTSLQVLHEKFTRVVPAINQQELLEHTERANQLLRVLEQCAVEKGVLKALYGMNDGRFYLVASSCEAALANAIKKIEERTRTSLGHTIMTNVILGKLNKAFASIQELIYNDELVVQKRMVIQHVTRANILILVLVESNHTADGQKRVLKGLSRMQPRYSAFLHDYGFDLARAITMIAEQPLLPEPTEE